jgi:hypothetical protein
MGSIVSVGVVDAVELHALNPAASARPIRITKIFVKDFASSIIGTFCIPEEKVHV